jgi:hypothetical protein
MDYNSPEMLVNIWERNFCWIIHSFAESTSPNWWVESTKEKICNWVVIKHTKFMCCSCINWHDSIYPEICEEWEFIVVINVVLPYQEHTIIRTCIQQTISRCLLLENQWRQFDLDPSLGPGALRPASPDDPCFHGALFGTLIRERADFVLPNLLRLVWGEARCIEKCLSVARTAKEGPVFHDENVDKFHKSYNFHNDGNLDVFSISADPHRSPAMNFCALVINAVLHQFCLC